MVKIFDMSFYVRLPAGLSDFGGHDDGAVVFRLCLKILVQAGIDPVLVFRDGYLTVVRRDCLRNPAKVGQRVVVGSDPVEDVAAGHAFNVEIVAERQCGNKDGYGHSQTGIVTVVERQCFPGKIQFQIDGPERAGCGR